MHFQLTEDQLMIQKAARDFAHNECLAGVIERDELQKFPKEQVSKLAYLGFMGMMVDPQYGERGMGMEASDKVNLINRSKQAPYLYFGRFNSAPVNPKKY